MTDAHVTDDGTIVCERCGEEVSDRINLWAHRHRFDLLSSCESRRLHAWLDRWVPWRRND